MITVDNGEERGEGRGFQMITFDYRRGEGGPDVSK